MLLCNSRKKIPNGRKSAYGCGRTDHPFLGGHGRRGFCIGFKVNIDGSNGWVIRGRYFCLFVIPLTTREGAIDSIVHIALIGSYPNFPYIHIGQSKRVGARDGQVEGATCGLTGNVRLPFTIATGGEIHLLGAQIDRHLFISGCGTPNRHGHFSLYHHVTAKNSWYGNRGTHRKL
jgi:hypothetical protein